MRYNAMDEDFEEVEVLGMEMLFTCSRIDRAAVPEGLYMYEVRHDDDSRGDPCEIARWVLVNHWGTLISKTQVELEESSSGSNAYREIEAERDWNYTGEHSTLKEYLESLS